MKIKKNILGPVQLIILSVLISVGASIVYAGSWAEPTANPPGNNAEAPINITSTPQTKDGTLIIGANCGSCSFGVITPASYLAWSSTYGGVLVGYHGSSVQGRDNSGSSGTNSNLYLNNFGGNVCVGCTTPSQKLTVNGNVLATAFFYSSDASLKTNIIPLSDSLSKLSQLTPVSFNWKDSGAPSVGLIAQDVEKVYPELVSTDKTTGLKSVEYGNLVAPLIDAIKTQQKEINELKAEVEALKAAQK